MRGLKDRRLKWDGDAGRARKSGVKKPTRKLDVLSTRISGKWKKVRLLTRMEVGAAGGAAGGGGGGRRGETPNPPPSKRNCEGNQYALRKKKRTRGFLGYFCPARGSTRAGRGGRRE